jgi:hypothetical protein
MTRALRHIALYRQWQSHQNRQELKLREWSVTGCVHKLEATGPVLVLVSQYLAEMNYCKSKPQESRNHETPLFHMAVILTSTAYWRSAPVMANIAQPVVTMSATM